MDYFINQFLPYFRQMFPMLVKGLKITAYLSLVSFSIALVLAVLITVLQLLNNKAINSVTNVFKAYCRATPVLIQLFIFYYGLPEVIEPLKAIPKTAALAICLSLNSAAYISEILRGATDSVDRGQYEASISFGMSLPTAMRRVISPQASVAATPSIINAFLDLIKMTSLGMTVGIMDIMGSAQYTAAVTYRTLETYLIAAVFYWAIIIVVTQFQKKFERRISVAYKK